MLELVPALPLSARRPYNNSSCQWRIFFAVNDDILCIDPWGESRTNIKRGCKHPPKTPPSLPSPGTRLAKKSPQAVKDRFCHSRPCVAPLKGQHHLTLGLHISECTDLNHTEEKGLEKKLTWLRREEVREPKQAGETL